MNLNTFNEKFVNETYDENGVLETFELSLPDNFNFAYDVVDEIAGEYPDKVALVWLSNTKEEKIFTFGDLSRQSTQVANMLLKKGVVKGDRVLVVLKRHWQIWLTVLALHKIGAILIPATNQLKPHDYVYRLQAGNIKYIIATPDDNTLENIEEALTEYDKIAEKFSVKGYKDGWVDFDSKFTKETDTMNRVPTKVSEGCLAFFSSGTTGYPKMVMHSHSYPAAHLITAKHWQNLDDTSLHLTLSESGWGKFFWGKIYGQFMCGAAVFAYDFDRFNAADILAMFAKYKITSLCAPPTMYRFFNNEGTEKYDLSSLKYACTAGEALPPEDFNQWKNSTGITLMEGFGQTESVLSIGNLVGTTPKVGSMGKPVPLYKCAIVDAENNPLPNGESGEIVFECKDYITDGIFLEYYGNEETTAATKDGKYYHTGDIAWRDEDGYLFYVGRNDDIIKSSGYRIGPFEIESVLVEHPAVLEVAVTGVPDPVRGKAVKATIVLSKGYTPSPELIKELQNHVKTKTAPYKYPRVVEFVDSLPKTISGKIRRTEIREKDNA
jgi:acetyl-CoA synthetase